MYVYMYMYMYLCMSMYVRLQALQVSEYASAYYIWFFYSICHDACEVSQPLQLLACRLCITADALNVDPDIFNSAGILEVWQSQVPQSDEGAVQIGQSSILTLSSLTSHSRLFLQVLAPAAGQTPPKVATVACLSSQS